VRKQYHFRRSGDDTLIWDCDRLVELAAVSSDGRVMDGMHRVVRAALEGRERIDAVRFEVDPEPDTVNVDESELPYEEES
jgi:hypothetical protein